MNQSQINPPAESIQSERNLNEAESQGTAREGNGPDVGYPPTTCFCPHPDAPDGKCLKCGGTIKQAIKPKKKTKKEIQEETRRKEWDDSVKRAWNVLDNMKFGDGDGLVTLNGVPCRYTVKLDYFGDGKRDSDPTPHIDITSVQEKQPNPLTETGYRSIFTDVGEYLLEFANIQEFVTDTLKTVFERECIEKKRGGILEIELPNMEKFTVTVEKPQKKKRDAAASVSAVSAAGVQNAPAL